MIFHTSIRGLWWTFSCWVPWNFSRTNNSKSLL